MTYEIKPRTLYWARVRYNGLLAVIELHGEPPCCEVRATNWNPSPRFADYEIIGPVAVPEQFYERQTTTAV